MDYDIVNNEQREEIYRQRNDILNADDISETVKKMIDLESHNEKVEGRDIQYYEEISTPETYDDQKEIILSVLDREWMQHIDNLEQLRQSIGLQAYAQKDPVIAYRNESYELFAEMIASIRETSIHIIMEYLKEQKENTEIESQEADSKEEISA